MLVGRSINTDIGTVDNFRKSIDTYDTKFFQYFNITNTKFLYLQHLIVSAAISLKGTIGPIFIDQNVTGESYCEMMEMEVSLQMKC